MAKSELRDCIKDKHWGWAAEVQRFIDFFDKHINLMEQNIREGWDEP
jgi:hypothetical protein